jgi:hypothetical protein
VGRLCSAATRLVISAIAKRHIALHFAQSLGVLCIWTSPRAQELCLEHGTRTTMSLTSMLHLSLALMRDNGRAPTMSAADNVLGVRSD